MNTQSRGEAFRAAFRKWHKAKKHNDALYTGQEPRALEYGMSEQIAELYRAHEIKVLETEEKFALGISTGEERRPQTTPNDALSVTGDIG